MRYTLITFLLTAAVFAQKQPTHDGNWLLAKCSHVLDEKIPEADAFDAGYCMGYIAGHSELAEIGAVCFRPNITMDQIHRVILKSLRDSPSELDFPAPLLIGQALHRNFPCSKEVEPSIPVGAHLLPAYRAMFEEAERLGRSLGYADEEIVEAFDEMPEKTVSFLRAESTKKVQ